MKLSTSLLTAIGLIASLITFSHSLQAGQVVIQPGPEDGKDIWTTSVYSYAPGGGGPGGGLDDEWLQVGGWGDLYYSLIEFDLTGMPPVVLSAKLEFFVGQNKGDGTTGMYLDRITEFWDWKTQGTGSDRERLWWADRPAATQWIFGALPPPTVGQWYSIDITGLYNAWQNGTYPNYGIQLRPVSNDNRWNEFFSSNYIDDPSLRPRLVLEVSEPPMNVQIDIKPGSFPNSINLGSAGVVPVAILSSASFDATQVDPTSVTLAGAKVKLIGKGDKYSCHAEDVNGDTLLDLVCQVVTAQFMIEPGDSIAVLEAETFSGKRIRGEDSIQIVP